MQTPLATAHQLLNDALMSPEAFARAGAAAARRTLTDAIAREPRSAAKWMEQKGWPLRFLKPVDLVVLLRATSGARAWQADPGPSHPGNRSADSGSAPCGGWAVTQSLSLPGGGLHAGKDEFTLYVMQSDDSGVVCLATRPEAAPESAPESEPLGQPTYKLLRVHGYPHRPPTCRGTSGRNVWATVGNTFRTC